MGGPGAAGSDAPTPDTAETIHVSSLALLKMLKHCASPARPRSRACAPTPDCPETALDQAARAFLLKSWASCWAISWTTTRCAWWTCSPCRSWPPTRAWRRWTRCTSSSLWTSSSRRAGAPPRGRAGVGETHALHSRPSPRPETVVGWYHSHPGWGCWLSGVDMNTQQVRDPPRWRRQARPVRPHAMRLGRAHMRSPALCPAPRASNSSTRAASPWWWTRCRACAARSSWTPSASSARSAS